MGKRERPSREELYRFYCVEEMSTTQIARKLNVNPQTIFNWMKIYRIGLRNYIEAGRITSGKKRPSEEELDNMYNREYLSTIKIARKYDVKAETVRQWLKRAGIKRRDTEEAMRPKGSAKPAKEKLEILYRDENLTAAQIAEIYDVRYQTILRWMEKYGIPRKSSHEKRLPKDFAEPLKEDLENMYLERKMTLEEMARKFQVSSGKIKSLMENLGIKIRSRSEVITLTHDKEKPSKEKLYEMYVQKRMTAEQVAKTYNVSNNTIARWLNEYKIRVRNGSEAHLPKGFIPPTKEELEKRLYEDGLLRSEIAKEYGVSRPTISSWIKKFGLVIEEKNWKSINYTLKQAKLFLEKENFEILPSSNVLDKLGYSALRAVIIERHGGFPVFRQLLNRYLGRESPESNPLEQSLLEVYVGETGKL